MSELNGIIGFNEFKVSCIIGTCEHERVRVQDLFINIQVETNIYSSTLSDNIQDTIDYVLLAELCEKIANEGRFYLIEKLAAEILKEILLKFSVNWAWIRIRKPNAIPNSEGGILELKCYKE